MVSKFKKNPIRNALTKKKTIYHFLQFIFKKKRALIFLCVALYRTRLFDKKNAWG